MHPALHSWREELPSAFVRLLAYLGGLLLLSMTAARIFQAAPVTGIVTPDRSESQWITIERPFPALALAIPEAADEPSTYVIRRNAAGVSVMFSHGVTMLGNTFTENWGGGAYGILMKEITDSRVQGNRFLDNTIGIYMEGTTRIYVINNLFSGNGYALKIQASCSSDTITHNNFTGNTFDIATNGSLVLNNFDGNYWDKYEGYDLDRNGIGDVPYHPVSLYSMIAEKNPTVMMLFHSFMVSLLDRTEKIMPGITPENLKDDRPFIKQLNLRP